MEKKLSVAFLWHMHQPLYKDLLTGKYHLPWVRLHSTYSYLDMFAILEHFPQAKVTFNITPSLLWQLVDISENWPEDNDTFLMLSEKNAGELSEDDKCFMLRNFFSCDPISAIGPLKKYKGLLAERGEDLSDAVLRGKSKLFSEQDFRDLQVFFNLAWCGFTLKNNDDFVKELMRKGAKFTEDEKHSLLTLQRETVRSILPGYKKLQDDQRIEISTTPYYHPILPLMCNKGSGEGFDLAADARVHIAKSIELYKKVFGTVPAGMWPAEGSVSPEIIPLLAEAGIKWIATDEGILLRSFRDKEISRDELVYTAHTAVSDGKSVDMVFRDINLSNDISFRYSHMPPAKAATDLIGNLKGVYTAVKSRKARHVAAIILDGENPWPYYPDGGRKFLWNMYSELSSSKEIELVTIGEYTRSCGEKNVIEKLYSGSWIDSNFRKWIGSPQKNKAWEYLNKVRKELYSWENPSKEALEELYIAEGSDWFWWYDDFGTELNFVFDELFRMHLANIFRVMGRRVPHYLDVPVPTGPAVRELVVEKARAAMERPINVLIAASESVPFAKTGGLADVVGSLPKALRVLGCDVRVIMPLYEGVKTGGFALSLEASNIEHPFIKGMKGVNLYSHRKEGVTTYFIEHDKFFKRKELYGSKKGDYRDNGMRFSFFSKAVLAAAKAVGFRPDILHCNDWQTALIPFYLKFQLSDDAYYHGIKTLFTIHNLAYQGMFGRKIMKRIGIPESFFNMNDLEFYGKVNFMKSGILYSDMISTVSHKYAEEIMMPEYGAGLDGLLRTRHRDICGIPNGVDYSLWSPKNDDFIKKNYDENTILDKMECKKDLIRQTGLDVGPEDPLIGIVTRLAWQKGMDLVAEIMGEIVELGCGVVILGKGSKYYDLLFSRLAKKYNGKVHVSNAFNDPLAHKIEAGCDMFLMPSRYEPCGLNQMYSIKYGTIPVVRATGGLDDVITDFDEDRETGNGFKFGAIKGQDLLNAVKRAVTFYKNDKGAWEKIMKNGMACDFSWTRSAEKYMQVYREMMK